MKIQPISTWYNGEQQNATSFVLSILADNLETSATLYYQLQKEGYNETFKSTYYINLITAELVISGQDYKDWSVEPDANTWIYNWAAAKLNLVLITE